MLHSDGAPTISTERPLLKKSKTINDAADDSAAAHFPGPLFPTVRRISTIPRASTYRSPGGLPAVSPADDEPSPFADRDWMYPSFLGPYAARSFRSPARSQKSDVSTPSPRGGLSVDVNFDSPSDSRVNSVRAPTVLPTPLRSKTKPRMLGKELKPLSTQISAMVPSLAPDSVSSAATQLPTLKPGRSHSSGISYLLMLTWILTVSYAIHLQTKVTKLQN